MAFQSSDEARTYAVKITTRHRTHEESVRWLDDLRGHLSRATDDESRKVWQDQIDATHDWLESSTYKAGNYPQGIDELVLELIEWRAMQHAFELVDTQHKPFVEHAFYQQWLIGSVYAVYSLLGKLTGTNRQETSLVKLWRKVEPWIRKDRACAPDELQFINARLNGFTNAHSRAVLFRNSVIAHNEKSFSVAWSEIDKDVQTLSRVWSLLVSWSSFGLLSPFRSAEHAFGGLEAAYEPEEVFQLKRERQAYIDQAVQWMTSHLHSGEHDSGRGPFAVISVKTQCASNAR